MTGFAVKRRKPVTKERRSLFAIGASYAAVRVTVMFTTESLFSCLRRPNAATGGAAPRRWAETAPQTACAAAAGTPASVTRT